MSIYNKASHTANMHSITCNIEQLQRLHNVCFTNNTESPMETEKPESDDELLEAERKKVYALTLENRCWRQRVYSLEKLLKVSVYESNDRQLMEDDANNGPEKFYDTLLKTKTLSEANTGVGEPVGQRFFNKEEVTESDVLELETINEHNNQLLFEAISQEKVNLEHEVESHTLCSKMNIDLIIQEELERIESARNEQEERYTIYQEFKKYIKENSHFKVRAVCNDALTSELLNYYITNKIVSTNNILIEWVDELMNFTSELLQYQNINAITHHRKNNVEDISETINEELLPEACKTHNLSFDTEPRSIECTETCRDSSENELNNELNRKEINNELAERTEDVVKCADYEETTLSPLDNTSVAEGVCNDLNTVNKYQEELLTETNVCNHIIDEEQSTNNVQFEELPYNSREVELAESKEGERNLTLIVSGNKCISEQTENYERNDCKYLNTRLSQKNKEEIPIATGITECEEEYHVEALQINLVNNFESNQRRGCAIGNNENSVVNSSNNINSKSDADEDDSSYEDIDVGFDPFT